MFTVYVIILNNNKKIFYTELNISVIVLFYIINYLLTPLPYFILVLLLGVCQKTLPK